MSTTQHLSRCCENLGRNDAFYMHIYYIFNICKFTLDKYEIISRKKYNIRIRFE